MIIVADSGSTKTDWQIMEKSGRIHEIQTIGLNPYFVNTAQTLEVLEKEIHPFIDKSKVAEVHFYGSGCTHKDKKLVIDTALSSFFKRATVEVESDLLGTARAVCGEEAGIVAILGTGSNSCVYDGESVTSELFSMGYILGDEGSGAVLGKKILKEALSGKMPAHLLEQFRKEFPESPETMLDKIYKQSFPSRFLASFAPFAIRRMEDEWITHLLQRHLEDFFDNMVTIYPDYQQLSLNLCGSIAWYLKPMLADMCHHYRIEPGNVIQRPIEELAIYHLNRHQA